MNNFLENNLNTIILGDSYKLIKQIPDDSIDLVYIDIPYQTAYSGGGSFKNKVKNAVITMNENIENLMEGIDYSILDDLCRVLKTIYIYIWCSKSQIQYLINYFTDKGCNYNILCWCKNNPVPFGASNFLSDIEYCLCFYEKGAKFYDGVEHKSKFYISNLNWLDKKKYNHPTIKPLELVKRHLLNSTQENDIVLDCFSGSGTTCVACKELNRQFLGIEINPTYYQISVDRLNGILANGQISFDTNINLI